MKKVIALLIALSCLTLQARDFKWSRVRMDGSRTGVTAPNAENTAQALGSVSRGCYKAPNGKTFRGGVTPAVAGALIAAQPRMAEVKQVIAYAPRPMLLGEPESELSNWFIDELMRAAAERSGKKVDVGITNFGGVRVDMPQGDVLLDDILSMFPFKNYLCYVELKGKEVRALLEQFAATRWQIVGGARCKVKDGKLVSAEIDGKPINDKKTYGVATISFLLNGGDGIFVARNAVSLEEYHDTYIIDVMLPYVKRLTAEGKNVEYQKDGRIVIE